MRVRLYRNLSPQYRKQRAWSLMAMEGPKKGLVLDVVDGAVLSNVKFVVSEAGRKRVIRDKAKNVHAFVDGTLVKKFALNSLAQTATSTNIAPAQQANAPINYDPYKMKQMRREDCKESVKTAPVVVASPGGVFAKLGKCKPKRLR